MIIVLMGVLVQLPKAKYCHFKECKLIRLVALNHRVVSDDKHRCINMPVTHESLCTRQLTIIVRTHHFASAPVPLTNGSIMCWRRTWRSSLCRLSAASNAFIS